jgi:hypothetical protein
MNHLSEDELILHYYGEADDEPAAELHLEECGECRALLASLQRTLNAVAGIPMPELPSDYGAWVWQRIEGRIPAGRGGWRVWMGSWRFAAAAAGCAALMTAAFFAGRFYPQSRAGRNLAAADAQTSERVLRSAVGDYLERSQMVLSELANADPDRTLDISNERERAGDLVAETRLYRQTAERTGDTRIAAVLDELELALVDISHAPSQVTPPQLADIQHRLEADSLLFKVRVLDSNVRSQEMGAAQKL